MKYFKYIWAIMIILIILIRSYGYEPSYIKREINVDQPQKEMYSQDTISMVYDPVDQVYYSLDEFNQLSVEQLKHFKGIGDVTASSIIEYIRENRELSSFYELIEIKGIGEKKLEGILENSK
ncbi:MAG: helix-hairpin-helix domain-containing protein [Clostridia bacterium]|nr:helix-hairpin-helix domain-containing protein [Clostridia bacterium]